MMRRVKARGGRDRVCRRPGRRPHRRREYFCDLIRLGYVDVLLSGNALAVHDIEVALSGTSLGIDLSSGHPVEHGHRNHMRAINAIRRAGGIAARGRDRRAHLGHHARVPHAQRPVHPRRIDPRRRPAARDDDGPGRGAGRLRARRSPAWTWS